MDIRPIMAADASRLDFACRLNDAAATRLKLPDWASLEMVEMELAHELAAFGDQFLVAEADGQVLAFGGLAGYADRHGDDMTTLLLYGPVVRAAARRRGVGGQLLKALMDLAGERFASGRMVVTWVSQENEAARALVKRFEFAPSGAEFFMRIDQPPMWEQDLPAGYEVIASRAPEDMTSAWPVYRSVWSGAKPVAAFVDDVSEPPSSLYYLKHSSRTVAFFQFIAASHGHGRIEYVAVHPDYRGRGLGTAFMGRALDMIWADAKPKSMRLSTHTDNDPAHRLYHRLGFGDRFILEIFARCL